MVSLDADLEKLADSAVADWPEIVFSGQFDAAIRDLYRSHLQFPPSWSQEDRDEFIENNADRDATQLSDKFDDLIDTVIESYGRQHHVVPHSDDARAMINAARKVAVYDLGLHIETYAKEIAETAEQPWPLG